MTSVHRVCKVGSDKQKSSAAPGQDRMKSPFWACPPARLILLLLLAAAPQVRALDRDFAGPAATRHYTRQRTFDVIHVLLELRFDVSQEAIYGRATTTLSPLNDSLQSVALDAVDLRVDSVFLASGVPLAARSADGEITVTLDRPYGAIDTLTFTIVYSARPRLGVYFIKPDAGYPDKPAQIWTQGEMEDSRHWFPCYDAPNEFYTTEMRITVRAGQTAVSNGKLVGTVEDASSETVTYHWRTDEPHVTYLTSFAVGRFTKLSNEWNGIPIEYYVDLADADKAERSFARTPDMMRFYSSLIGIVHPYPKYAQVTVEDFRWGGMENQSATTLTRRTLRDATALLDGNSDGLVAHELAHQWWGDLLTARNWNHIWLNEGFATYFDALYTEYARGPDEFLLAMLENRDSYMKEDSSRYRRAIVTDTYENPEQMFDRHSYPKGAWVLHMIRYVLGEERWVKAIRHYAEKFKYRNVDSEDFRKAVEEATGDPLEWFFAQWVYRGGHPEYEVSWSWDDALQAVGLRVQQVQKVDALTPLFRMPVEVELTGPDDSKRLRLSVATADQTFYLPFPARPDFVQFDPDEQILKTVRFDQSREGLVRQLQRSRSAGGRIRAALGLVRFPVDETVAALASALKNDSCRGVRAQAAWALGEVATLAARAALGEGFKDPDARVRRKVAEALGKFVRDGDALALLKQQFRRDSSYQVRAEIVKNSAKLKLPDAFDFCVDALRYASYQEVIRAAALEGMAELRDARGIDFALEWSAYGKPQDARVAAVKCLAVLAQHHERRKPELLDFLVGVLVDPDFRVRRDATLALGDLGDSGALDALERLARREADFRAQRAAREAIRKIEKKDTAEDASALNAELRELRRSQEDLGLRLERLETSRASGAASEVTETKGAAGP